MFSIIKLNSVKLFHAFYQISTFPHTFIHTYVSFISMNTADDLLPLLSMGTDSCPHS